MLKGWEFRGMCTATVQTELSFLRDPLHFDTPKYLWAINCRPKMAINHPVHGRPWQWQSILQLRRERGWMGFEIFFFFEWAVLYGIRFFPLRHLVSKPFAPTILTANVKLTDVLELDTEWDRYKATTSQQHCLSGVTTHLHPAAFLGARLLSGQFEGLGAALTPVWLSTHHTQAQSQQNSHVNEIPTDFFSCYLWGKLYPPITKLMSL